MGRKTQKGEKRTAAYEDGTTGGVWIGAEITDDVKEFVMAMDRYKREHRRPFPTWSEVLEVAKSLGYKKAT